MPADLFVLLAPAGTRGSTSSVVSGWHSALSLSDAPFWAWWLPPVLVTVVVAVVVAAVRRERRRPVDTVRSVEDYARFRQALALQDAARTENGAATPEAPRWARIRGGGRQ